MTPAPVEQTQLTPRTDTEECDIIPSRDPNYDGPHLWVESDFARALERELNTLRAQIDAAGGDVAEPRHIFNCVRPEHLGVFDKHILKSDYDTLATTYAALRVRVGGLEQWVNDLQSGMYVNCVYCGHRYGPGETTPVTMADALKQHIEICPKHPMSALAADNAALKGRAERADAKVDALMLEYCPDEMTQEQKDNWASHQMIDHPSIDPRCEVVGAISAQEHK